MKVFVEIEFIENFEIEFSEKINSDVYRKLYKVFTEYPNIECYLDTNDEKLEEVILNSEILTKLADINPRIYSTEDFKKSVLREKSFQTLLFTAKEKDWFVELKDESILFFTYDDFETQINQFIEKTHKKFDLSFPDSKFDWHYFEFISDDNNILFLSDPYVLGNQDGQKIKDNLLQLLSQNLNTNKAYKVFILTEFQDDDIIKNLQFLNRELAGYSVKIYLINRIKSCETIGFHDRLLYTNFTITESPSGFNLKRKKPVNSEVTSSSIFEKYTYQKHLNHMKGIKKYLEKLEKYTDYNNTTKFLPSKTLHEFSNIIW